MTKTGAVRGDWKTRPMPEARATIALEHSYTLAEFAALQAGLVPEEMEDKWFIFFEDPWLYLHRSWTGFCIFQVRFETTATGVRVAEALVNRDPAQYGGTSAREDASLLAILLDGRARRDVRGAMIGHIKGRA